MASPSVDHPIQLMSLMTRENFIKLFLRWKLLGYFDAWFEALSTPYISYIGDNFLSHFRFKSTIKILTHFKAKKVLKYLAPGRMPTSPRVSEISSTPTSTPTWRSTAGVRSGSKQANLFWSSLQKCSRPSSTPFATAPAPRQSWTTSCVRTSNRGPSFKSSTWSTRGRRLSVQKKSTNQYCASSKTSKSENNNIVSIVQSDLSI